MRPSRREIGGAHYHEGHRGAHRRRHREAPRRPARVPQAGGPSCHTRRPLASSNPFDFAAPILVCAKVWPTDFHFVVRYREGGTWYAFLWFGSAGFSGVSCTNRRHLPVYGGLSFSFLFCAAKFTSISRCCWYL
uniref:Uncharacterized protein n=1 Tax=Arundo donax TaxID=35708 RepID=A0A0A9CR17_ARUDO